MCPRGVGLATASVVAVPADSAADAGEHVVAELDQVEWSTVTRALGS